MAPVGSREEFAGALAKARLDRHLSIRQAARIADVPPATAQGWLSGKHFPTPALRPQYLALVAELGLAEQIPDDLFDDPWPAMQPNLRSGAAPYLGLRPFGVADAPYFFGRSTESARLAVRVAALRQQGHGVLALVGPSGSGKSSLLAAGLIATECCDGELSGWRAQLVGVADLPGRDLSGLDLVVVDQFEDVLRLPQREACLAALEQLGREAVVVIGLRSDAFAEASQLPQLVDALSAPVLLAPVTREELRDVVVGPALLAGATVEDDLVRALLHDLAAGPGGAMQAVLPLLSSALLATWAVGSGDRMTVADYYAAGGVSQAVESLAEQVYGSLSAGQQAAAEHLFLRLVGVSADAVVRESLPLGAIDPDTRPVMDAFVTARMLTVAGDAVQISHDALLAHWRRLHDWVSGRRDDLVVLAKLRRAAAVWEDAGRDPSALVPVDRLEAVAQWLDDPLRAALLTPAEREFIQAGEQHFASVLVTERRANLRLRRQRRLAWVLTAATMALALVAGFAFLQARGFQLHAERSEADAQSRQVAITARSLRDRDPNLVAQLARVSTDLAPTLESASVALDATAIDTPVRWLGEGSAVLAVSPDQQVVARADGGGQVTLWRGAELDSSPGTRVAVDPAGNDLYAAEFAQVAGRLLLAVGGIGSRSLWDVTGQPVLVADWGDPGHTTYTAAFSPDGSLLAFGNEFGQVDLLRWDGATARPAGTVQLDALGDGSFPPVKAVVLGDGVLYAGGAPGAVTRWRLAEPLLRLPDVSYTFNEIAARTQTLALSPDGGRLLAGLAGRGVLRWQIEGDELTAEEPIAGFDSYVNDVSFAADGATFIAGSSDQSARVYDTATGTLLRQVPGPALVTGAGLVGSRPVTTGTDGTLRAWPATSPVLRAGGDTVYNFASDNSGTWLGGGTPFSGIQLWRLDGEPRQLPTPVVELPDGDQQVGAVGLAGDAGFVVGGSANGRVISWPLTEEGAGEAAVVKVSDAYLAYTPVSPDGSLVAAMEYQGLHTHLLSADAQGRLTKVATLPTPTPQLMGFNADSTLLAVALAADQVDIWSVADPEAPRLLASLEVPDVPGSVSFAPSRPLLAVGLGSGVVQLWDLTDPAAPVKLREFGDARSGVDAVSFDPEASMLLGASGDDRIWGWDLTGETSTAVLSVDGAIGSPWDVRVVQGGAGFVVSGSTGMVRLWRLDLTDANDWLCGVRGDPLTPEEWQRHLPGVEPRDPC